MLFLKDRRRFASIQQFPPFGNRLFSKIKQRWSIHRVAHFPLGRVGTCLWPKNFCYFRFPVVIHKTVAVAQNGFSTSLILVAQFSFFLNWKPALLFNQTTYFIREIYYVHECVYVCMYLYMYMKI